MRSGNLNYTIPLIKAMARSGWSASFNLSYNSQNWRQETTTTTPPVIVTWHLGQEVRYGYGWRLQAGSLMPVYSGYFTLHHYSFTDATGADDRLEQHPSGGVTSTATTYLPFNTS